MTDIDKIDICEVASHGEFDFQSATAIVEAIAAGKVPAVTIQF